MPEIQVKTVTKQASALPERTVEAVATLRAESIIESDNIMVHTIVHADGEGLIHTYERRDGHYYCVMRQSWKADGRVTFRVLDMDYTRAHPDAELPHSPADNYLGS